MGYNTNNWAQQQNFVDKLAAQRKKRSTHKPFALSQTGVKGSSSGTAGSWGKQQNFVNALRGSSTPTPLQVVVSQRSPSQMTYGAGPSRTVSINKRPSQQGSISQGQDLMARFRSNLSNQDASQGTNLTGWQADTDQALRSQGIGQATRQGLLQRLQRPGGLFDPASRAVMAGMSYRDQLRAQPQRNTTQRLSTGSNRGFPSPLSGAADFFRSLQRPKQPANDASVRQFWNEMTPERRAASNASARELARFRNYRKATGPITLEQFRQLNPAAVEQGIQGLRNQVAAERQAGTYGLTDSQVAGRANRMALARDLGNVRQLVAAQRSRGMPVSMAGPFAAAAMNAIGANRQRQAESQGQNQVVNNRTLANFLLGSQQLEQQDRQNYNQMLMQAFESQAAQQAAERKSQRDDAMFELQKQKAELGLRDSELDLEDREIDRAMATVEQAPDRVAETTYRDAFDRYFDQGYPISQAREMARSEAEDAYSLAVSKFNIRAGFGDVSAPAIPSFPELTYEPQILSPETQLQSATADDMEAMEIDLRARLRREPSQEEVEQELLSRGLVVDSATQAQQMRQRLSEALFNSLIAGPQFAEPIRQARSVFGL